MTLPGGVSVLVGEDDIIDQVELDTHRMLYVTSTRAIAFRERSLFTEESVEVFPTNVKRLLLNRGKRQSTVTFEYTDRDDRELQLPSDATPPSIRALLESVVRATDVLEGDESIIELYRLNELTVIVTDQRLIKHVGQALWALPFDSIDYETVRDIESEVGQMSTGVFIRTTEGSDRFKLPKDVADRFVSRLEEAVCDYHDVPSVGVLRGDPDAGKPDPEPDLDRLRPLQVGSDDPRDEADISDLPDLSGLADLSDEPDLSEGPDLSGLEGLSERSEPDTRGATPEIDPELVEQLSELTRAIERQQDQFDEYLRIISQIERDLNLDR